MTNDPPVACSLGTGELKQRVDLIAEIGKDSLTSHEIDGERHLLRFQANTTARHRLEGIVAAEAECCSFLDLSLREEGAELILSIAAPKEARAVADEFAGAFSSGSGDGSGERMSGRGGLLIGLSGALLALCCVAVPAILGVAIGASLGNVLDVSAAILIAVGIAVVLHRRRKSKGKRVLNVGLTDQHKIRSSPRRAGRDRSR